MIMMMSCSTLAVLFMLSYVSIPWGSAGPDPHNNFVVRVLYGLDPHNNLANIKKGRFLMFQTVHLECHQQRSFTLKMHQNRWRLGLRPRPHWGSLQRSPRLPSWIKGPTSKGRGRWGMGEEGEGGTLDSHNVGDRLTPMYAVLFCNFYKQIK